MNKTVLITGASSGIGASLAREFAGRGCQLALCARNRDKLEALAEEITSEHPGCGIEVRQLDVTDVTAVSDCIEELAGALNGLDVVIANAGIGGGGRIGSGHFQEDQAIIQTNVIGAMATIDAAMALFQRQSSGHIVAISSVAASRGLPRAGAYAASKAALATYMEALEIEVYHTPIRTTTLFPGYIDTPINQMLKSRPFLIDVEKGARIMVDLIERQVTRSTVPVYPWNLIGRLLKLAPKRLLAGKKMA